MSVSIRTNSYKKDGNNNTVSVNGVAGGVASIKLNTQTGGATNSPSMKSRFNSQTASAPSSGQARPVVGKPTPKPSPGRFAGMESGPAKPSFGGSAADRMAQFREAAEKEKAAAERKKSLAEEKAKKEELAKIEAAKPKEEPKKVEPAKKEEEEEEDDNPEKKKSQPACKRKKQKAQRTMSISNIVMDWVQEMTKDYPGVEITNFSTSWKDGLAFCALIHRFNPDEFDFNELSAENRRHNFDLAFSTGQKVKKIPLLLDTSDLLRMKKPEPRSVQTYVQWVWSVYGPESGYGPSMEEIKNAAIA